MGFRWLICPKNLNLFQYYYVRYHYSYETRIVFSRLATPARQQYFDGFPPVPVGHTLTRSPPRRNSVGSTTERVYLRATIAAAAAATQELAADLTPFAVGQVEDRNGSQVRRSAIRRDTATPHQMPNNNSGQSAYGDSCAGASLLQTGERTRS